MGLWIAAAVLLVLAILPLGIRIRYNEAGFFLKVIVGSIKITVFPRKKKLENRKPREKKPDKEHKLEQPKTSVPEEQPQQPDAQPEQQEKGGSLTRFMPLIQLGLEFLGDLRRKLRLDNLYLRLILASDDPCDLAVNYGRVWAAVGNLIPQLERLFVIKKRDIQVECDFTAAETRIAAHLDITITLGRLLVLAIYYGIRVLIEFLSMKRKGGGDK